MSQALTEAVFPEGLNETLLSKLITDLGQQIWTSAEIAERYGLSLVDLHSLISRPQIRARVRQARAIWEADDNIKARAQTLSQVVYLEALTQIGADIMNPNIPLSQRSDALKVVQRGAGLDADRSQGQGTAAAPVSITFNFSGVGQSQTITTVVEPPTIECEVETGEPVDE